MNKIKYILLCLFFSVSAYASDPYIVCSDLTNGPTTGWDGSSTKGAAISIWGLNFGSAIHTSYITVGGQTLYADESGVAEWAATTNPTTARGLQRITFYLNSSMSTTGTAPNTSITVTTAAGTSNSINFHCRALGSSQILFIDNTGGSDSTTRANNDLSNPWETFAMLDSVEAGDCVYVRAGTYDEEDAYDAVIHMYNIDNPNGTEYNSIAVSAYPGENVQVGSTSTTRDYFFWYEGSVTYNTLNYWTFSKLTVIVYNKAFYLNTNVNSNSIEHFTGFRVVGNSLRHMYGGSTGGVGFTMNLYGEYDNLSILANYFPLCGKGLGGAEEGTPKYCIYIGGANANAADGIYVECDGIYIRWNEFYNSSGRGIDLYAHKLNDLFDNVYISHNLVHGSGTNGLVIGGGDNNEDEQYYASVGSAYIYSNIFSTNGSQIKITEGSWGSDGGNFYVYNNTFYYNGVDVSTCDLQITDADLLDFKNNIVSSNSGASCYITSFGAIGVGCAGCAGINNDWFGQGDGPSWSTTGDLDSTDPEMTNPGSGDFILQEGSPCITAGTADVSSIVTDDYYGVAWSGSYDIGAIKYGSSSDIGSVSIGTTGTGPTISESGTGWTVGE